ncbi:MAG: branched-chain amino acid ABC transporter permease [Proteobacteria bacterium]|nr:branched-chain amino acid ABC transporter permease [Pseudomonadota bacterium]MDA0850689.1 branched-chain amino acid ABC transporter permease [Pseudomonadota bacterium]MDA1294695.1 branched-chain amino acid ABC transporter permease [Pseudomonadota bacterium]
MNRNIVYFAVFFAMLVFVGMFQSWTVAFSIFNLCLISAIMALGVNIQWGYAGLFSVGTTGFVALGGVAAVVTSMPPVQEAWTTGGARLLTALVFAGATIVISVLLWKRMTKGRIRGFVVAATLIIGFFIFRYLFDPAVAEIESVNPAAEGYLGGLGLHIIFSWIVGGLFAAGAAWMIGKVALGLRSDYLAIATLGISEIIIAVIKNEDWLTRGVKNVNGIPRPVAYEVDLQQTADFVRAADWLGIDTVLASSLYVKFSYGILFLIVLGLIIWLSELSLNSPWGRMMRAIRDNEEAAAAMGKDVTKRHLQVFVIGSAVCGIAGAMLTSLDGLLTPASYQPLRFTFLIWVMVIVGGSGNNWGAVLGGFIIWFLWIEVEPLGLWIMEWVTSGLEDGSDLKDHLRDSAAHMRLVTMGAILLLVLRFNPKGLIPEK